METGKKWKLRLMQLVALCVLVCVVVLPLLGDDNGATKVFSRGWTWNGQTVSELAGATQGDNLGQETIVLKNTISKEIAQSGYLLMRSSQQTMYVTVGNETVYVYDPVDSQPYGKAAPSQWNIIELPADSRGQTITITLYSPISLFEDVAQEIRYGTELELYSWVYSQSFSRFLLGMVICSLGFMFYLTCFFLENKRQLGHAGLFVLCLGLWCICESGFLLFLPGSSYFWGVLTFQTLWLAPVFFCLTMDDMIGDMGVEQRSTVKFFAVLCGLIQWVFYVLGKADFIEMLPITYVVLALTLLENGYFLWLAWKIAGERRTYVKGFVQLLLFLVGCFVLECIGFFCGLGTHQGLFVSVGVILYIFGTWVHAIDVLIKGTRHAAEINRDLLQQRVAMVRSQIQPHFLFNTLTSIRALIRIDADKAYELVGTFSQYLRTNINAFDEENLIAFQEELNHIRTYMEIELVRFGSRVAMMYDVHTTDFFVPPLSIQPFVENAVKHGVCKRESGGTITLRTYEEKELYIVELIDNGVGFDKDNVKSSGVGLSNGIFRLQTLANAKVDVKSTVGKGTTIRIQIPKLGNKKGDSDGLTTD